MGTYYFYNPDDGRTIGVRGPATMTRDQAQRIFDAQRSVGALIGLKRGEEITPEFQLANGLKTAEAAVLTDVKQALAAGNVAVNPIFFDTAVTVGINSADYSKQSEASVSIGNITRAEMTGILAQVKKLTGQEYTDATNLGAGKYALTVPQLERAGYIKPGTANKYLSTNLYSTVSVLGMSVWTGKDGVTALNQLLQSSNIQDQIQQALMSAAYDQLIEVGVGITSMPANRQAGLILLAAINIDLALEWINNASAMPAIPVYGPLPYTETNNWQVPRFIVRDAAYAVEFSDSRTNNSMKNEITAQGYTHTVNRQAINSAANQIVGNDKVPKIAYGAESVNPQLLQEFNTLRASLASINTSVQAVLAQQITVNNGVTKEAQLISLRKDLVTLKQSFDQLLIQAQQSVPVSAEFLASINTSIATINAIAATIDSNLQFISRLLGRRNTG